MTVRRCSTSIGRLRPWRIRECAPDMLAAGEINTGGETKLEFLPCSLILSYQGLEEENLDQISPGPPSWGLRQQAIPLLIEKRKLLKSPLEI